MLEKLYRQMTADAGGRKNGQRHMINNKMNLSFFKTRRDLFLYLAVGGLNTAFGYGVYAIFLLAGLHYTLAALASQILGAVFNYYTYGRLVFRQKPRTSSLLKFGINYTLLYFLSIGILTALQFFGLNAYLAGVVNAGIVPLLSFVSNKYVVFRPRKEG